MTQYGALNAEYTKQNTWKTLAVTNSNDSKFNHMNFGNTETKYDTSGLDTAQFYPSTQAKEYNFVSSLPTNTYTTTTTQQRNLSSGPALNTNISSYSTSSLLKPVVHLESSGVINGTKKLTTSSSNSRLQK